VAVAWVMMNGLSPTAKPGLAELERLRAAKENPLSGFAAAPRELRGGRMSERGNPRSEAGST